ncbi:putative chromosomal organization and dna repair protein [Phaeoacremonium minimum UCRPA7]|uniref:Putative chromosomal organization and dna repair protein n=1 Tax=Phaeoacremonium minimum (strain UCR-PA7) TaxID=1286976 RepID=R8BR26_PHAM7|nr:putative chromosomal organization and dna repair protein [Phaeoacremonium minimum UCRPA7]EOO01806.1 putative chromosomal organization and dna repair protein [Phaeoacremonium minimum UCRPA7]
MSSRRGLLSNARRHHEASTSSARQKQAGPTPLPPYEPPSCPLNDAGKRALAELANSRDTKKYETHVNRSIDLLRGSVGAINDRLQIRRNHAQRLAEKIQEGGGSSDRADELAQAQQLAVEIGEEVDGLTARSETAMREVIDLKVALEDERAVVQDLQGQVTEHQESASHHRQRGEAEEGEDEDEEMVDAAPPVPILDLLKTGREAKAAEYNKLGMYEKYATQNDYILFKKTWHDAVHPDDDIPLPDATTWFGKDGQSATTGKKRRGRRTTQADDDDDEIMVEREVISYKCPLTLATFKEPYSSKLCKHTFEKSAILGMIRQGGGQIQCPQTGCSQVLKAKDLFLDDVIVRKIKRAQEAEKRAQEESDSEPDEDGDRSMAIQGERDIKAERVERSQRGRRVVEDIEDEEV